MESSKQSILFHKRPITDLRFHPDGDVFFASSKDCTASMINLKGEILGSFEKHEGSISTLAVHKNNLITAGMDLSFIMWDVITGNVAGQPSISSVVRGIDFSSSIFFCTDHSMNKECFIGQYDPRTPNVNKLYSSDVSTTRLFRYQDSIIFSTTEGTVHKLDLKTNKIVRESKAHQGKITSLRPSACRSFFVTASSDSSVKIIDSDSFSQKKKFDCDEPINSACIFSTNDKLVAVGGIDAKDVTTTRGKGTFDTNVFDVVTQNKVGTYTTHFGTINAVDTHPHLNYYCSGGEDGSVCLIKMGKDFFDAPFTNFNQ